MVKRNVFYNILLLLILLPQGLFSSGKQYSLDFTSPEEQPYITLFCAASTTDIMEELGEQFFQQHGIEIRLNPASSGILARQLAQGAPADLYVSASKEWIDYVIEEDLAFKWDGFMQNDLVLIAPKDSSIEPFIMEDSNSFAELTHLIWAIGDPNHVPAGKYGQQSLEYFNLYKMLEDQGIVTTANVRAALMLVELEEADLGIVYKSDAQKSDKVKVLSTFPTNTHLPIEYYCGLLDKDNENAQAFYDFLLYSTQANSLYQEYGFIPLSKED